MEIVKELQWQGSCALRPMRVPAGEKEGPQSPTCEVAAVFLHTTTLLFSNGPALQYCLSFQGPVT